MGEAVKWQFACNFLPFHSQLTIISLYVSDERGIFAYTLQNLIVYRNNLLLNKKNMVIDFSISNFRSIRDKQTLSFEATNSTHLEEYFVMKVGKYRC